jgi:ribose transport system permease protein
MNQEMSIEAITLPRKKRKVIVPLSLLKRNQGLMLSIIFFIALLGITSIINGRLPSYFGMSMLIASATTLALASIGQSIIIIGGGLDLSVGAIVSFSQVILAVYLSDLNLPPVFMVFLAIITGVVAGGFNGFFVAYVGLQPIIVTLATMFTLQGLTLLILPQPGGVIPESLMTLLLDDTIIDLLPGPLTLILIALAIWGLIKTTKLGTSIFAAGSDYNAAGLVGINVKRGVWFSYIIGGGFYGAAGAFIATMSGAADPLIGAPLMVSTITAVMLGGTLLSGGRGTAIGSVFGALTVIAMVNLLLAVGAPDYLSSAIQAIILLMAVIVNRPKIQKSENEVSRLLLSLKNFRVQNVFARSTGKQPAFKWPSFNEIVSKQERRLIIPAWVGFAVLVIISFIYYGKGLSPLQYTDRLLILAAFLAILALGQGVVIISGGFDLSVGWTMTTCGVIAAMLMQGRNSALIGSLPAVLAVGAMIGLGNGLLVTVMRVNPIVATLASAGILQSLVMFVSGGTPTGDAAPALKWFVNGKIFGAIAPITIALFAFIVFGVLLLKSTTYARRLIATGSNQKAAFLSGVNVRNVTLLSYMISGICAGLAGFLLTGFLGRASLAMGTEYLLPTVAAVSIGGTLITGGRGHYLGIFGGVMALIALQILLSGTQLPPAVRDILLGLAVLLAIIFLREKK